MIAVYIVKSRTSDDKFPVYLRSDCDRTFFDLRTGKDESLFDLINRYNQLGYDVLEAKGVEK